MKKIIAFAIGLILMFEILGVNTAIMANGGESNYVRFIAKGGDPYADFTFSADGVNQTINPDVVKYAAIRYKTAASVDSEGKELVGQLFISPAVDPYIPVKYNFSGEWETVIVDCTNYECWNSRNYMNTKSVRFDPLGSKSGSVNVGDYIDIAWIAFFTNRSDANAYTGSGNTPYCLLDVNSLANPSSINQLVGQRVVNGIAEATPKPILDDTYGMTDLFAGGDGAGNVNEGLSTGWWLAPLDDSATIRVSFDARTPFNGMKFFAFVSRFDTNMVIKIYNGNENLLWKKSIILNGSNCFEINFGDTVIPAGRTMIEFVGGDNSAHGEDAYFVLGSAPKREDMDEIIVSGGDTNEDTQQGVAISLCNAENPAPTKAPTPVPTPTASPTPTPKQTLVPTATLRPSPTLEPTETPWVTQSTEFFSNNDSILNPEATQKNNEPDIQNDVSEKKKTEADEYKENNTAEKERDSSGASTFLCAFLGALAGGGVVVGTGFATYFIIQKRKNKKDKLNNSDIKEHTDD